MRHTLPLTIASWVLALLVTFLAIVLPASAYAPDPRTLAILLGASAGLLVVGAVMSMFPRSAPRLSARAQLAAIAPLPALTLGFILASHGILTIPGFLLVFTIVLGGGIWLWARRESPPAAGRWGELMLGLILAPTLLVLGAVMLFSLVGSTIMAIAVPNFSRIVQRASAVELLVPFRPAVDAGITFEGAGDALAAIVDTTVVRPGMPAAMASWRGDSMMQRAVAGLTADERTALVALSGDVDASRIQTIAHAGAMDPWRYLQLPLSADQNAYSIPIPKVMMARDAARRHLYRAALAQADRKPAVAESLTREVIGYGLRLRDDSDHLIMAMLGASVAREGGKTLGTIWRATGRSAAADSLAAAELLRDSSGVTHEMAGLEEFGGRTALVGLMQDPTALRALRWESAGVLGLGRCTNLREAVFGPAPDLISAYDAGASALTRNDREREVFAAFRRGFSTPADATGIPVLYRLVGWAVGPHMGACLSLATSVS